MVVICYQITVPFRRSQPTLVSLGGLLSTLSLSSAITQLKRLQYPHKKIGEVSLMSFPCVSDARKERDQSLRLWGAKAEWSCNNSAVTAERCSLLRIAAMLHRYEGWLVYRALTSSTPAEPGFD